jgi:hypothetical protein
MIAELVHTLQKLKVNKKLRLAQLFIYCFASTFTNELSHMSKDVVFPDAKDETKYL